MQRTARHNAEKIQIFWTGAISRDNASLCAPRWTARVVTPVPDACNAAAEKAIRGVSPDPFALLCFADHATIIAELQGSLSLSPRFSSQRPQDAR